MGGKPEWILRAREGPDMEEEKASQKAILRFLDGRMLKGFIRDFTLADNYVYIEDESSEKQKIKLKELKAIFFVKDFLGNSGYREKKSFSGARPAGKRLFIRFKDGEHMTGFLDGDTPWEKGFFLEKKEKGFFFIPVDGDSNNVRIFVVTSSLQDVTQMG
jgi:hypothetical protein